MKKADKPTMLVPPTDKTDLFHILPHWEQDFRRETNVHLCAMFIAMTLGEKKTDLLLADAATKSHGVESSSA